MFEHNMTNTEEIAAPASKSDEQILRVEDLTVSFDGFKAINNLSLSIKRNGLRVIIGPNGAGKSTLMGALAGELRTSAGTIEFDGRNLTALSAAQQSRIRAVLPQKPGLGFEMSVTQVTAMGAYPFSQASPTQLQGWVMQSLELVDLSEQQHRSYLELSGGEQQRVHFARVLVQCWAILASTENAYLLLDEPVSNLDPKHRAQLMKVILNLAHTQRVGVLLSVHDVNLAAQCDKVVLMADHTVIAQGEPESVLTADHLRHVFDLDMQVIPHPLQSGRLLVLSSEQ